MMYSAPARTVVASLIALAAVLWGSTYSCRAVRAHTLSILSSGSRTILALSPIQHRVAALAPENTGGAMALNSAAAYVGVAVAAQIGAVVLSAGDGVLAIGVMGALLKAAALLLFLWSLRPLSAPRR